MSNGNSTTDAKGEQVPDISQESYLKNTAFKDIAIRGLKKMLVEVTSLKTLFLAFICVACAYNWLNDMWTVIGGLATLGVKELPADIFNTLLSKFSDGKKNHDHEDKEEK